MKCPRDNTELVQVKLEKKSYMKCPTCSGHYIGLTGAKLHGIKLSDLNPKSSPCALPKGEAALMSPSTDQPMKHFVYEGISLDYCAASNSVWMDSGELHSLVEKFVTKGKNKKTSSEYGILDGIGDGVIGGIGDVLFSLFDGV